MTASSKDQLSDDGWQRLQEFLAASTQSPAHNYELLRKKLNAFFRWRGCYRPDEYTDATFDRVARTLLAGTQVREKDPAKYLLGVARLIFLERSKSEIRQKNAERAAPSPGQSATSPAEKQALSALDDCLHHWPPAQRNALLHYHRAEGGARILERKALAKKQGIPLNTLRIRMFRDREKLEECVRGKLS